MRYSYLSEYMKDVVRYCALRERGTLCGIVSNMARWDEMLDHNLYSPSFLFSMVDYLYGMHMGIFGGHVVKLN